MRDFYNEFSKTLDQVFEETRKVTDQVFEELRVETERLCDRFEIDFEENRIKEMVQNLESNTSFSEIDAKKFIILFGKEKTQRFVDSIIEEDKKRVYNVESYSELDDLPAKEGDQAIIEHESKDVRFKYNDGLWMPV